MAVTAPQMEEEAAGIETEGGALEILTSVETEGMGILMLMPTPADHIQTQEKEVSGKV